MAVLAAAATAAAQAPAIDFYLDEKSPEALYVGDEVTVRWTVVHAAEVHLSTPDGVQRPVDAYGAYRLRVMNPGTPRFRLTVLGADGARYEKTVDCRIRVGVYKAAPAIALNLYPRYPQIGQDVRLTWRVSDAARVRLTDPDGHTRTVPLNGAMTVRFVNPGRHRYRLFVKDRAGRRFAVTAECHVAERPR